MSEDLQEFHTERWCAGFALESARPLDAAERATLGRRVAALRTRMRLGIAAIPLGIAGPIALLVAPRPGIAWLDVPIGIVAIAAMLFAPVALGLYARDRRRERLRLEEDLEGGEVLRFAGRLDAHEQLDEEQVRLLQLGVLRPERGMHQELEVLPASGTTVVDRATGVLRFETASVTEVAAGPRYAMRVAVPREQAWIDGAPEAEIARRSLNASERAELGTHVERLRRPNGWVLLWALWVTAWVFTATMNPQAALGYVRERWVLVGIQAAMLTLVAMQYFKARRLAALLEQDTSTGWALTLAHAALPGSRGKAFTEEETTDSERVVEFLPHSRAVWSEQGKPARWRNLRWNP